MTDNLRRVSHCARASSRVPSALAGPPKPAREVACIEGKAREAVPLRKVVLARTVLTAPLLAVPAEGGRRHALAAVRGRRLPRPADVADHVPDYVMQGARQILGERAQCGPQCEEILRTWFLGAEPRPRPDVLMQALAESLGGCAMSPRRRVELASTLMTHVAESFLRPDEAAQFIAGLLRGACAHEAQALELIGLLFQCAVQAHRRDYAATLGDGRPAPDRLPEQVLALAKGAGGAHLSVQRFDLLLARVQGLTKLAGPEPGQALHAEDLARLIGRIVEAAGGSELNAALRSAVMAHVCAPQNGYDEALRGAMAYHLGLELVLARHEASQQAFLREITGGGLDAASVGAMAWGLGLHLCRLDPEDEDWHEMYAHIVVASQAPPAEVVQALMRRGWTLSPPALERLAEGLAVVVEWLDPGPEHRDAARADARGALAAAAKAPGFSAAQSAAVVRGLACAARHAPPAPGPDALLPSWWGGDA